MTEFWKSSYCGNGGCVEVDLVSAAPDVRVRDSKNVVDPYFALRFSADEWRAFVAGVKAGEFDV